MDKELSKELIFDKFYSESKNLAYELMDIETNYNVFDDIELYLNLIYIQDNLFHANYQIVLKDILIKTYKEGYEYWTEFINSF